MPTTPDLAQRLDPRRFPNMSPQMQAIVGYLFETVLTDPALAEVTLTADGRGVLAVPVAADGTRGPTTFLAATADLRANLARLGMAADLVRRRLGLELAAVAGGQQETRHP